MLVGRFREPLLLLVGPLLLVACVDGGALLWALRNGTVQRWYYPINLGTILATLAVIVRWRSRRRPAQQTFQ
jgi:hypothetical protein